ncbi:ATP-dependent DNA helicase RecG [Nigerium massiliense]|uniref:ATP-dependent DNA helicase RecG n=1 Tax=Nigerium massiliense TaxID=1522317 RepID=UPI00058EE23D|nr:ATP-dependent DNA helicase RecG [Nigerium massiliense]
MPTDEISVWHTDAFRQLARPLAEVLGDKTAKAFAGLRVHTVGDLLRHVPRRYLAGTELTDLTTIEQGEHVAVMARVAETKIRQSAGRGGRPTSRLEVRLTDGHGRLNVTFFGRQPIVEWWERQLRQGVRGIFVGKVGSFRDELQMSHPQFVMLDEFGGVVGHSEEKERIADLATSGLVGMYPASAKLPTWTIAECVRLALDLLGPIDDPWPAWVRTEADVPELAEAFRLVHRPATRGEVARGTDRLLFDEAFTTQLTMAYRRADNRRHTAGPRPRRPGGLLDAFDARLPFELTAGQRDASEQILADLAGDQPMQRLLQGEVGSGKTLVALRAMLTVVDAGGQAVLLAPTEVLAAQHYRTITDLLGDLSGGQVLGAPENATDVVLVTGSLSAARKKAALLKIASGEAGIVVGTHALLADQVQFADLGLVVIDEQHRFGVEQRAVLSERAQARPHVLVLTATPIPRSVAMTVFGDLEVSTLAELPGGRAEVVTTVVDARHRPAWVERAWERIAEEVAVGRQAFVVVPRIASSGEGDERRLGVVDLAERLASGPLAGVRVGVLHGQLPAEEKDAVMAAVASGEIDVLVATTVIEVGVDVPNASVMVIWDADHFGISQLHQLRGRIGRGSHPGVCLLVSAAEPEAVSWERLAAVAATRDGFALADLDLVQRREGDVLGADQSGRRSTLRLLSVLEHADVITVAHDIAEQAVVRDPECATPGFADAVTEINRLDDGWVQG